MTAEKTFRAILIDPDEKTVTEVFLDKNDLLQEWYKHCRCGMVEAVVRHINGRRIDMIIDEEGRIKDPPQTPFGIKVDEVIPEAEELCGPTLCMGAPDEDGESQPAPEWMTVELIEERILWSDRSHAEFPEHWVLKILFVGQKDNMKLAVTYANPHHMDKLHNENKGKSQEEMYQIFEEAGVLGLVHLEPKDFGVSQDHDKLAKIIEDSRTNVLMRNIIDSVMEKVKLHVAENVLKIEPENLFILRQ